MALKQEVGPLQILAAVAAAALAPIGIQIDGPFLGFNWLSSFIAIVVASRPNYSTDGHLSSQLLFKLPVSSTNPAIRAKERNNSTSRVKLLAAFVSLFSVARRLCLAFANIRSSPTGVTWCC